LKSSFIDLIRSILAKRDAKFRHKLSIFMVCLGISVIIWITIKLSDEYDTVIQIPVTYTNIPKEKVVTYASDTLLHVEIFEKGSDILRMNYLQKIAPVAVNLKYLPLYPKDGEYEGIITTTLLINDIERELNLIGKILAIRPDSIYLYFDTEKMRKVPVNARFNLTFEKEFMQYGPAVFTPDSVEVRGAENSIDMVKFASLGVIKQDKLSQNFRVEKKFANDSTNRNLTFYPSKVTVSIPVEKYTEAEMEVPVRIIHSNGLNVKTFPDKIRVFYNVALKDYSKIEPGMIVAVADISTVNLLEEDRIKVNLESFPTYIHINKIEPDMVEFIIIK
jgi:hypothetical protein